MNSPEQAQSPNSASPDEPLKAPAQVGTGSAADNSLLRLDRPLRFACAGGAPGTFIGDQHRDAVSHFGGETVSGCFSRTPEKSQRAAETVGIDPTRAYNSIPEMIEKEGALPADKRPDALIICTFNAQHFEHAAEAVKRGMNIIVEKPMTATLEQALELKRLVEKHDVVCMIAQSYSGVPAIREISERVQRGDIGKLLSVHASYLQSWMGPQSGVLPENLPEGSELRPQARWRIDPEFGGPSMTFADIGLHAFDALFDACGNTLTPTRVMANLATSTEKRSLDDFGWAIIQTEQGVDAMIRASQVHHGAENDLLIEINGTEGSLRWEWNSKEQYQIGRDHNRETVTPEWSGHQFNQLYGPAMTAMANRALGEPWKDSVRFPDVDRGVRGVQFITRCLESTGATNSPINW